MINYLVSINAVREKIFLIKLIRACTGWGLGDSKYFVEENFTFGELQGHRAEFDITINAEQFGKLAHYSLAERNLDRMFFDASREVTPQVDKFDLTP